MNTISKEQEQTVKEALNIAMELLCEGFGVRDVDDEIKTVDDAWNILFNGDEE